MLANKDLYSALGVDPASSAADIKKAYRRRARETHPDHGGDREKFEEVSRAALVLMDPDKRAKYDRTGDAEDSPKVPVSQQASELLSVIVSAIIDGDEDPFACDLIDRMDAYLKKQIRLMTDKSRNLERKRARAQKMASKFKRKKPGANMLARFADDRIKSMSGMIEKIAEAIAVHEEARKQLKDYSFERDIPQPGQDPTAFRYSVYFKL